MTKIVYKTGDLFKNDEKIIVHSCNILGGFGSGVAGVIARLYPEVREDYITAFEKGELKIGTTLWSKTKSGISIGNMICQPTYGAPDARAIRHVSYDAVDDAIRSLSDFCFQNWYKNGALNIAMPLIGSDRGGGSWAVISNIIENRAKYFTPVVYTLDGRIPE